MLLFRKASSQKVFVFCFSGSYNIDQHDYSVRMRAARKFLQDGDKVVPTYFVLCYRRVLSHFVNV